MNDVPLFQIRQLKRSQGNDFTLVVDSLEILRSQTLCLVGPPGAGKSTLLRLLTGFERPDSGEVLLDGARLDGSTTQLERLRQIVMVHQKPLLLSGSVSTNLDYGLRVRGISRTPYAEQVVERLGLKKLLKQSAKTLSGGQTQLVALARALVVKPKVLLLDEPTANLDPAHVAVVEAILSELQATHGTTIIWTTHNLFQARRVARRIGLLLNGDLIEVAATEGFFNDPRDSRTRDFVQGKMIY